MRDDIFEDFRVSYFLTLKTVDLTPLKIIEFPV